MAFQWTADPVETGEFLRKLRERRESEGSRSLEATSASLLELVNDPEIGSKADSAFRALVRNGASEWLKKLEAGETVAPDNLQRHDIELLARAYRIPVPLLDLLFSDACCAEVPGLVQSFSSDERGTFECVPHTDNGDYGDGDKVSYWIPQQKLSATNQHAIGVVRLGAEGTSGSHDHPGTEFALNLGPGTAVVRFPCSGVEVQLARNEFIHFRSTIPHVTRCLNEETAIFVIRSYQLNGNRSLRARAQHVAGKAIEHLREHEYQIDELKKLAERLSNPKDHTDSDVKPAQSPLDTLLAEIRKLRSEYRDAEKRKPASELKQLVSLLTTRVSASRLDELRQAQPKLISDRVGLAMFLQELVREFKQCLNEEDAKAKERRARRLRKKLLDEPESNPVTWIHVREQAELLGIHSVLLYPFLYPTEPDIIVGSLTDLQRVPTDVVSCADYSIPRQRLALSSLDISVVELGEGASTPPNQHPGTELILPLGSSVVTTTVGGRVYRADAQQNQYIHFNSAEEHCAAPEPGESCRFLVIRMTT